MSNKVFGVGWPKTGTKTLRACFWALGYNHQTVNFDLVDQLMAGNLDPAFSLAKLKDSFEGWPWIYLYRQLDNAFPGSRFILTTRQPERWLRSYKNMMENPSLTTPQMNKRRQFLYGFPHPGASDEQLIERMNRHDSDVIRHFHHRPAQLLVVDWERGDEWEVLCDFLNKPTPGIAFPHANKGVYPTM